MNTIQNGDLTPPASLQRQPTYSGAAAERSDLNTGHWQKCRKCEQLIYQSQLEENLMVCPLCGFHYPLPAWRRVELLTDANSFVEHDSDLVSYDVLDFAQDGSYGRKLEDAKAKTRLKEAVITGEATLDGQPFMLAVMDFGFMGASMGSAVGEKIARLVEAATATRQPVVLVTASGGARMQEGALSLMQMAKTSAALMRHDEAGLLAIVILTNPTTGGVTASFASLGDIILAEPKALVGFAGPRVIEQTTKAKLPDDFQSADSLLRHGFIDRIVERRNLRRELSFLLGIAPRTARS